MNEIKKKYVPTDKHAEYDQDVSKFMLDSNLPDLDPIVLEQRLLVEEFDKETNKQKKYDERKQILASQMIDSIKKLPEGSNFDINDPLPSTAQEAFVKIVSLIQNEKYFGNKSLQVKISLGKLFLYLKSNFSLNIVTLESLLKEKSINYSKSEISRCICFSQLSEQFVNFKFISLPIRQLYNVKLLKEIMSENPTIWRTP